MPPSFLLNRLVGFVTETAWPKPYDMEYPKLEETGKQIFELGEELQSLISLLAKLSRNGQRHQRLGCPAACNVQRGPSQRVAATWPSQRVAATCCRNVKSLRNRGKPLLSLAT